MFEIIQWPYVMAGAITGIAVGLTGVGAGALMTPLLLLVFGVAPVTAIATDLWFAAITKLVGAQVHHQAGQVDWQVVKRLWWGSLPVAFGVVLIINSGLSVGHQHWLTEIIGFVVFVTAIGLLLAPSLTQYARERRLNQAQKFKAMQPLMTVVAGAVLGLCVALTSIGAGALGSILLLYLYPLRMTPHRLVGTDLVHAIPLAVVSGLGYLWAGRVDWHLLVHLLAGSIPAILLSSYAAQKIKGRWLQILLASVLMMVGLKTCGLQT